MKKKHLIEMLEGVDDDMEIYIWNGFVEDFQDIEAKAYNTTLSRFSLSKWYTYLKYELMEKLSKESGSWYTLNKEQQKACYEKAKSMYYKTCSESGEGFAYTPYQDLRKGLETKDVIFIQSTPRGLETFDRRGRINY